MMKVKDLMAFKDLLLELKPEEQKFILYALAEAVEEDNNMPLSEINDIMLRNEDSHGLAISGIYQRLNPEHQQELDDFARFLEQKENQD